MSENRIYVFVLSGVLMPIMLLPLRAQRVSQFETGYVYKDVISSQDVNTLYTFAKIPKAGTSNEVFEIIRKTVPESIADQLSAEENLVLFIAVGGANQILHIRKYTNIFEEFYVDPTQIEMSGARNFLAIWITDDPDYFTNSVEVDITRSVSSVNVASFSAPSPYEITGLSKEPRAVEIGIKRFEVPFQPSLIRLAFTRRDLDTYERRVWNRTFYVTKRNFLDFDFGFLYALSQHGQGTFLTFSISLSLQKFREEGLYRFVDYLFFPHMVVGIGLPFQAKFRDNSFFFGYSFPIRRDLIYLTIGYESTAIERSLLLKLGVTASLSFLYKVGRGY